MCVKERGRCLGWSYDMQQRGRDENLRGIQSQRQLQQGVKDGKTVLNKKYTAEKDKCGECRCGLLGANRTLVTIRQQGDGRVAAPHCGLWAVRGCTQFGFAMPKRRGIIHSPQHVEVNKARNNEIKVQQGKLNTAVRKNFLMVRTAAYCNCLLGPWHLHWSETHGAVRNSWVKLHAFLGSRDVLVLLIVCLPATLLENNWRTAKVNGPAVISTGDRQKAR